MEKHLIDYCSPTLACIKVANLFSYKYDNCREVDELVERYNRVLGDRGVFVRALRCRNSKALIYVYRRKQLQSNLNESSIATFLKGYGYENTDVEYCLDVLETHLAIKNNFPHEIGIFLGYPLGDVLGFIRNGGKNQKCTGCWKVYCNVCDAQREFCRYRRCTKVYSSLWNKGKSILSLTV